MIYKHIYSPRPRPWGLAKPMTQAPVFGGFQLLRAHHRRHVVAAGITEDFVDPFFTGEQIAYIHTTNSEGWVWRENQANIFSLIETEPDPWFYSFSVDTKLTSNKGYAIGSVGEGVEAKWYALYTADAGKTWETRYSFNPIDLGHAVGVESGTDPNYGYWFTAGHRIIPALSGPYDVYVVMRAESYTSGPHGGEFWNHEPRLIAFHNEQVVMDETLPFEDYTEPLLGTFGEAHYLTQSDFSHYYDKGYFMLQNMVYPYVTGGGEVQGGERIYQVTSRGIEHTGTLPEATLDDGTRDGNPYLDNIRSVIFKPETNTLLITRYSGFSVNLNWTDITFNGGVTTRHVEKPYRDYAGTILQHKTDLVIDDTHSRSIGLGNDLFPLSIYTDAMQGTLRSTYEPTRTWRRQSRGLHGDTDQHRYRLY